MKARIEKKLSKRLVEIMPMREESASKMLGLLRDLMREAEKEEPSHDNQ